MKVFRIILIFLYINYSTVSAWTNSFSALHSPSISLQTQQQKRILKKTTQHHAFMDYNSFTISSIENEIISSSSVSVDGLEDAFTDDIVQFSPTIKLLLRGFVFLLILASAAKVFFNKMDDAIEKVLVDFETTMKAKYPSRWVSIESKLDGLEEPARSQRLFEIMEELQVSESQFMEQVNRDMASS